MDTRLPSQLERRYLEWTGRTRRIISRYRRVYNYNQYIVFKKGTTVTFSSDGYVTKGIIRDNQYLPYREDKHLEIAPSQEIAFEKGILREAVLLYDTKLEYRSGEELEFKAGTKVCFDDKGYVTRGTLTGGSKIQV